MLYKQTIKSAHKTRLVQTLAGMLCAGSLLFGSVLAAQMQGGGQQGQQGQQGGGNQSETQEELAKIQNQLQSLSMEIESVRSEASNKDKVQEALLKYNETLSEEMKSIDPDKSDKIERRKELFEQISANSDYQDMSSEELEDLQKMNEEFTGLREELREIESKANNSDKVMKALDKYNKVVTEEMKKIDGDIEKKMEKREELRERFSEMQQGIGR